jgi:hypothetical protein
MSMPTLWAPKIEHSTGVVPLPAKGSRIRCPGANERHRKASTSWGTNLPR